MNYNIPCDSETRVCSQVIWACFWHTHPNVRCWDQFKYVPYNLSGVKQGCLKLTVIRGLFYQHDMHEGMDE